MSQEQAKGGHSRSFAKACEDSCADPAFARKPAARSSLDWTSSPAPVPVPQETRPALEALVTTWSRRCASALQVIVRLEAEIYETNFGFGLPPGVKTARPDWLRPIDGGKSIASARASAHLKPTSKGP